MQPEADEKILYGPDYVVRYVDQGLGPCIVVFSDHDAQATQAFSPLAQLRRITNIRFDTADPAHRQRILSDIMQLDLVTNIILILEGNSTKDAAWYMAPWKSRLEHLVFIGHDNNVPDTRAWQAEFPDVQVHVLGPWATADVTLDASDSAMLRGLSGLPKKVVEFLASLISVGGD